MYGIQSSLSISSIGRTGRDGLREILYIKESIESNKLENIRGTKLPNKSDIGRDTGL